MSGVSAFPFPGTNTPSRVVCTSLTRPSSPYTGQEIYETDTGKTYTYNGGWVLSDGRVVCTSSTRPISPYQGQEIYETDTGRVYVRSASAWMWRSSDNGEETRQYNFGPGTTYDYSTAAWGDWFTISNSVAVPSWATRVVADIALVTPYGNGANTFANMRAKLGSDVGQGSGQTIFINNQRSNPVTWTDVFSLTSTGTKSLIVQCFITSGTNPVRFDGGAVAFGSLRFLP